MVTQKPIVVPMIGFELPKKSIIALSPRGKAQGFDPCIVGSNPTRVVIL